MKTCKHCETFLNDSDNYCHSCGITVDTDPNVCPSCSIPYNKESGICEQCGFVFMLEKSPYKSSFSLDFRETSTLKDQLIKHFQTFLIQNIEETYHPDHFDVVMEKFFMPYYSNQFKERFGYLAEDCYDIHAAQNLEAPRQLDAMVNKRFEQEVNLFFREECKDIGTLVSLEHTNKYQDIQSNDFHLQELVMDYLNFSEESDQVYFNLAEMPAHKIKNAIEAFLTPGQKEKIFFICDQSVYGSCTFGFAITENGLYWNTHFDGSHAILFANINDVTVEEEYLLINGAKFEVNQNFNKKMTRLLRKLQGLYTFAG